MENQIVNEKKVTNTERVVYTGKTHTTGGRDGGTSLSSDRKLDIKLVTPGVAGNGTNPEQLFAAGWSACFIGAMRVAAGNLKVAFPKDASVDTEVDLILQQHGYSLGARLNVNLPGLDVRTANAIAADAHQICPYSKATRGNINVVINVNTVI